MIITIASNCEDVGKSIIATNTAVLRTLVGRSALLIDIDPKRKSFEWAERRKQASVQPTIAASSLKGKHLKQKFAELSAKYIDVIIDTDWRNTTGNQVALELADMVIVPVAPGEGCVDNLKQMVRRIKAARKSNPSLWTLIVIVRAKQVVPIMELDSIRCYVDRLPSTALAGTVIREHLALHEAFSGNLSIFEYKPADQQAIAEMHNLYRAQKLRRAVLPSITRLQRA